MLSSGFFTTLFQQFVTLISAFCVGTVPGGSTPYIAAADPPTATLRQEPYITRVIETQFNAAVDIGTVFVTTADRGTDVFLSAPDTLLRSLNDGGIAALPAGVVRVGQRAVRVGQNGATDLVRALSDAIRAELDLLPGAELLPDDTAEAEATVLLAAGSDLAGQPLIVRIIRVQTDAIADIGGSITFLVGGVTTALLDAPKTVADVVADRGPEALPAGLQLAARNVLSAMELGSTRLIESVGTALQNELALFAPDQKTQFALADAGFSESPNPALGRALERIVRVPLAFGVAGADLLRAGLTATTDITGGYATATTDIVRAVVNQFGRGSVPGLTASRAEEPQTIAEALRNAPVTIRKGYVTAGRTLREGAAEAKSDFREALNPRLEQQQRLTASASKSEGSSTGSRLRTKKVASITAPVADKTPVAAAAASGTDGAADNGGAGTP